MTSHTTVIAASDKGIRVIEHVYRHKRLGNFRLHKKSTILVAFALNVRNSARVMFTYMQHYAGQRYTVTDAALGGNDGNTSYIFRNVTK